MISFKEFLNERVSQTKQSYDYSKEIEQCAYEGKYDELKRLVELGGDIDYATMEHDMSTPLMYAVIDSRSDIVEYLIKHGANVNTVNKGGYTSLMFACSYDLSNIVRILLDNGAEASLKNKKGKMAKDFTKNKQILQYLERA